MNHELATIDAQIIELQVRRQVILERERPRVIKECCALIDLFDIHPVELGGHRPGSLRAELAKGDGRRSLRGTPKAIKFVDSNGNTWAGTGLMPGWMKAAIATGKKVEDFLVKA